MSIYKITLELSVPWSDVWGPPGVRLFREFRFVCFIISDKINTSHWGFMICKIKKRNEIQNSTKRYIPRTGHRSVISTWAWWVYHNWTSYIPKVSTTILYTKGEPPKRRTPLHTWSTDGCIVHQIPELWMTQPGHITLCDIWETNIRLD